MHHDPRHPPSTDTYLLDAAARRKPPLGEMRLPSYETIFFKIGFVMEVLRKLYLYQINCYYYLRQYLLNSAARKLTEAADTSNGPRGQRPGPLLRPPLWSLPRSVSWHCNRCPSAVDLSVTRSRGPGCLHGRFYVRRTAFRGLRANSR